MCTRRYRGDLPRSRGPNMGYALEMIACRQTGEGGTGKKSALKKIDMRENGNARARRVVPHCQNYDVCMYVPRSP